MSARRPAPLALALLVALALASLAAAPAAAAPETIAGWGQGAGKVIRPSGVAVDQESGDLYVADRNNNRVDRFGSAGEFLLAWGAGVADGKSGALQVCGPAAPEPTERCFKGLNGSDEALRPSAVAVEAASGDVYVVEVGQRVSRFTPEGRFVFTLGRDVNKTKVAEGALQPERNICTAASGDACGQGKAGAGPGEFENPRSLALDSAGAFWVNDGERLQRFDSAGGFLEDLAPPAGTEPAALAIDPATDDFYVLGPQGHDEEQVIEAPRKAEFNFKETGEFTLGFEGETTGTLTGFPDPEAIQAELEALPAIGAGNVSVTAGGLAGLSRITFSGDLGGRDVPELVPTTASETPPVTVETRTQGSPGSVRRLDSTGALKEELDAEDGDLPEALATDSAGNLYVGDAGAPYHLERYGPTGELTSVFAAGQVIGSPDGNALALDEGSGERAPALYTASFGAREDDSAVQRFELPEPGPLPSEARAEDVLPTSASLKATLNPEGAQTDYRFQYATEADYEKDIEEGGDGFEGPGAVSVPELAEPPETLPGTEYDEEDVSAEAEGLLPATVYRLRIVAENEDGETEAQASFATRTAVGIEAQWAGGLSAREATLNARLDPLGAEGTWWVEYDTSPYAEGEAPHGTSAPLPRGALPASFGEVAVAVALGGLEPATAYHYRFAAADVREVKEGGELVPRPFTTYGEGQSFSTQTAGLGSSLPDSRAWELVSPPDKHGGRIAPPDATQGGPVQAAANGEALAYLSYGSLQASPEGNRIFEQSSELARRAPGGAWSSADITPPHIEAAPLRSAEGLEYKLFSTNLGRALLEPHAAVELSPYASELTPYLRENASPPAYVPLAVGCPPAGEPCPTAVEEHANVPAGTELGLDAGRSKLGARGASPDLRHVVLSSSTPLAPGVCREVAPGTGRWNDSACSDENKEHEGDWEGPESALYEWSAGSLEPLSVLPAGEGGAVVKAELGAGAHPPRGELSTRGAVSEDGSRVFWSAQAGGLYVRETARGETIRLDEEREGAFGTGAVDPLFRGASSDGSVALFTDTHNLTEDANEEGADLYRWRAEGTHGCAQEGGCLTDLSTDLANPGESAAVLGVPGIAADGSAAFLVARGVLDAAPSARGAVAVPGQPNLYAWREGEGARFVATLSGADSKDWGPAWSLTAQASPSGRHLAFMSERPLTGYDNRAVGSGERAQEVFRYDAATDELACASCNPSGARPRALLEGAPRGLAEELLDPKQLWGNPVLGWQRTLAALVPEASFLSSNLYVPPHAPRYVHDDGRVFFNAVDSLVPADSNGNGDVYQYEPHGAGSCSPSAADSGTATVPGGCVSLISSGAAQGPAGFLDASVGARDVFFYSPARLSVTDVDEEVDVYDAREGGEPAVLSPVAECLGEACQPPAAAPEAPAPASSAFRGPGNLSQGGAASPCAKPTRAAKRLSRRAKALRRGARTARRNGKGVAAKKRTRKARRLAHRAKRTSKRAKRCRRARAARRSNR